MKKIKRIHVIQFVAAVIILFAINLLLKSFTEKAMEGMGTPFVHQFDSPKTFSQAIADPAFGFKIPLGSSNILYADAYYGNYGPSRGIATCMRFEDAFSNCVSFAETFLQGASPRTNSLLKAVSIDSVFASQVASRVQTNGLNIKWFQIDAIKEGRFWGWEGDTDFGIWIDSQNGVLFLFSGD